MQDVTKDREKYIGGSDIPVLMGLSTFRTRYELLEEKAGLVTNEFKGNKYTEYGNVMETKIRDYISKLYKSEFKEDKKIDGDIRYHADGYDKNMVLEIKTTSQIKDDISSYKKYLVQLLTGMNTFKTKYGLLAVYERPSDFSEEFDENRLKIFEIELDKYKNLNDEINIALANFRRDLNKLKENPFLTESELLPKNFVSLAKNIESLENKLKEAKQIEVSLKEFKAKLFDLMSEQGIKKWTLNSGTLFSLVEASEDKKVKVFDEKKFKKENAEIWNKYQTNSVKKERKGYVRVTIK